MYTSLLLVSLSGLGAVPSEALPALTWQQDYSRALEDAQRASKPMAVFFARGKQGWDGLLTDGKLGKEAEQLLRAHYVCVYVDQDSKAGKSLTADFNMSGAGLVVSSRGGEAQAYRHQGTLS